MTRDEALDLLGLNGIPSPAEIEQAFNERARKYHPDRFDNADPVVVEVMNEKMQRLIEARRMLLGSEQAPGTAEDTSVQSELERIEVLFGRRQFSEALYFLDVLVKRHGPQPVFLQKRAEVLVELGQHQTAYATLRELETADPQYQDNADFQNFKAQVACGAGLHPQAIQDIYNAYRLAGTRAPAFVATEAMVEIDRGNAKSADILIDELRRLDPAHPLVAQRAQVMNIGGTYMEKQGATQGACGLCVLLELIFDCC